MDNPVTNPEPKSATLASRPRRPLAYELFAVRSSVTLLDVRLAMVILIGEAGLRFSLRVGDDRQAKQHTV